MKLILIILLLPMVVHSQKNGDDLIIVKGITFQEAGKKLLEVGYKIMRTIDDNEQHLYYTEIKEDSTHSFKYYLSISVSDNTMHITCAFLRGKDGWNRGEFDDKNLTALPNRAFLVGNSFAEAFKMPIIYRRGTRM
jgi:hypothetical protein